MAPINATLAHGALEAHDSWLGGCLHHLLQLLVLDRFADFGSDQVWKNTSAAADEMASNIQPVPELQVPVGLFNGCIDFCSKICSIAPTVAIFCLLLNQKEVIVQLILTYKCLLIVNFRSL